MYRNSHIGAQLTEMDKTSLKKRVQINSSALQATQLLIDSTLRDQNGLYKVQIFSGIFHLFSGKTCTAPLKICGPFAYVHIWIRVRY